MYVLDVTPTIIDGIFSALQNIATAFVSFLTDVFTKVVGLIWDDTNHALTVLGTLLLIAMGTGLVLWAFYFIRNLIRVRRG